MEDLKVMSLSNCRFSENWYSESEIFLWRVNYIFFSRNLHVFAQFGYNSVWKMSVKYIQALQQDTQSVSMSESIQHLC